MTDPLPEDAPQFVKDYYAYYKTGRGYHKRSLNSNRGWNITSSLSFLNMPILAYAHETGSAVLGNMEKVGSLGMTLPRNDRQITAAPGDLILYQGNSFVIYYDTLIKVSSI